MKLNFYSLKRKLFGSSPGKRNSKPIARSGSSNLSGIVSVFLICALLVGIIPILFADSDNVITPSNTTTSTSLDGGSSADDSVLELRKLKDDVQSVTVHHFDGNGYEDLYNDYSITINPIVIEDLIVHGFSCVYTLVLIDGTPLNSVVVKSEEDGVIYYLSMPIEDWLMILPEIKIFEVIDTANNTVDEWILSNTVKIDEVDVHGLRKYNDSVDSIFNYNFRDYDESNYDVLYQHYGFEVSPIVFEGCVLVGMSCVLYDTSENTYWVLCKISSSSGVEFELFEYEFIIEDGVVFNIISTNNAVVDDWLFANTKPVSSD